MSQKKSQKKILIVQNFLIFPVLCVKPLTFQCIQIPQLFPDWKFFPIFLSRCGNYDCEQLSLRYIPQMVSKL